MGTRMITLTLLVLFVLVECDLALSVACVARGARETNPVLSRFSGNPLAYALLRGTIIGGAVALAGPDPYYWLLIPCGFFGYLTIRTYLVWRRL